MLNHQTRYASHLVLMASLMAIIPSYAVSDSADEENRDLIIEEVVVTATKRTERLVDVPTSVQVVTGEMITNTSARSLNELTSLVPNVTISGQNGLTGSVSIRGVGAISRNIGFDTRVGVYLDGVYLGQSPALNQELIELESVEVLRGPQGALFGKNTVAGAINLISKKPGDEFRGNVKARLGNYNSKVLMASINVPLSDAAAVMVSVSNDTQDGFVENLNDNALNGTEMANRDRTAWRAALRLDPSENLNILIAADGLEVHENPLFGEPISDTFGLGPVATGEKPYEVDYSMTPTEDRSIVGVSADVTYTFDNQFSLRSISSYRETDFNQVFSVSYMPSELLYVDYTDNYEQVTQEFQFISLQGERLEYLLGLYYYSQDSYTRRDAVPGAFAPPFFPSATTRNEGTLDTESIAFFGNITYDLTDRLELGLGFRYSSEEKTVDWYIDGSESNFFALAVRDIQDAQKFTDFAPTVTLTYDVSEDVVAYVRYAEGYKSGGYNLDFVTEAIFVDFEDKGLEPVDAIKFYKETVRNYEAGIKGGLLDQRLRLSASIFHTIYDDYQVSSFRDLGEGRTALVIENAAKVETNGVEIEATYLVTENLMLSGGIGYLDAKYVSFPNGGSQNEDVSGNKLPHPVVETVLSLDYYNSIGEGALAWALHLDWNHRGSAYSTADNVKTYTGPSGYVFDWGYAEAHDLVNARLSLTDQEAGWSLALWARNLTDNDAITDTYREFFGTLIATYMEPRTFGLEVSYEF